MAKALKIQGMTKRSIICCVLLLAGISCNRPESAREQIPVQQEQDLKDKTEVVQDTVRTMPIDSISR